jgi:uncharacterized membrane protein
MSVLVASKVDEWTWVWGPVVLILWVISVAVVVWLVARTAKPRSEHGLREARELLKSQIESGEITQEEYRRRMKWLR